MSEWDSLEWREQRDSKMLEWFNGDPDAVACCIMISQISETWDDIVDNGSADEKEVELSYVHALIGLELNPFYQANRNMILPLVIISVNGWLDSNKMMKTKNKEDHVKAYVLRNLGLELIPLFAFITGGYEHMRAISQEARNFFVHDDFDEWENTECST